jgi:LysR family glycine cleavage system transcriptional activator
MTDLPNLNALRIFEAAARYESFTEAGREFGVTQSAVGKQVAQLEAYFGQPLFRRSHRRVVLTDFGRDVAEAAHGSLTQLVHRLDAIRAQRPHQITLVADTDFIQLWLLNRMFRFEKMNPDIRISLVGQIETDRPPKAEHHCAIIWGKGAWQGCRLTLLFANQLFAVAAPGYFDALGRAPEMADLTHDMLIHDRSTFWWSAIRSTEGSGSFDPEVGRIYNQTSLCLEAAAQGMGVTVGDEVTTRRYLESGRLVCPFAHRILSPNAYYIAIPETMAVDDRLQTFLSWLRQEARQHRSWYADYWARHDARFETA